MHIIETKNANKIMLTLSVQTKVIVDDKQNQKSFISHHRT